MAKVDHKRVLKTLYGPSAKEFSVVDVPALNFLAIDGRGDPNTSREYADAVQALYMLSYPLKFRVKKELGLDYVVMPLEGLWWVEDMRKFTVQDKGAWKWTMMIMQPEQVHAAMVSETAEQVLKKKSLEALKRVRFENWQEGPAAQIMYTGAYSDEGPTIAKLHAYIEELGHQLTGKHHEIYLGDPRKTSTSKLQTVLRQPMG